MFVPIWLSTWNGDLPFGLQMLSVAIIGVTAVRPAWGLLVTAALLPLASPLQIATDAPMTGAAAVEFVALPFVIGACAARLRDRSPALSRLAWPALLLAAGLAANLVVQLAVEQVHTAWPGEFVSALSRFVVREYFTSDDFAMVKSTLAWWLALALAVAAEDVLRRNAALGVRVTRMLITGAAAAGCLSMLRIAEVMIRRGEWWNTLQELLLTLRFNPVLPDMNAAGSLYALFALPVVWLAWTRSWRWAWPLSLPILLTLWISGSRTAFAACGLALAAALGASRRWSTRQLVLGGLVTLAAIVVAVALATGGRRASVGKAVTIRQELVGISLELAARRPVFGYGLGRFAAESAPLVSNTLQATWPAASGGENAHNNYLQILVELGAFGLVAFLWFVGAAFGPLAKQAWHRALGPEALGVTAGLLAFLLTCLGGHPLLLPRVLVPFGLFVGVAAGWTPAGSPRPWLRRVAVAAACAVLATAPIRAWQTRQTVDLTGVVIGSEIVDDVPDGSGWRVRNRARWFLPPATRLAVLPIRRTDQTPAPCRAAVLVDDRVVNEVIPTTDGWMNVAVTLEDEGRVGFVPLDIRTDAPACELVAGPLAVR